MDNGVHITNTECSSYFYRKTSIANTETCIYFTHVCLNKRHVSRVYKKIYSKHTLEANLGPKAEPALSVPRPV